MRRSATILAALAAVSGAFGLTTGALGLARGAPAAGAARHTGGDASSARRCRRPRAVQRLVFNLRKYPNIRRHFRRAVRRGWPRVLVLNRRGADARSDRLLAHFPIRRGRYRDEYPPAIGRGRGRGLMRGRRPRGWRASVAYLPISENRSHGAARGNALKPFCNGTRFRYAFRRLRGTARTHPDGRPGLAAPETPSPTPTPSDLGSVIWAGDGEQAMAGEWSEGNAFDVNRGVATSTSDPLWDSSTRIRRVTSPVAQGTSAYAMTVKGGDRDAYTSGAQRTELGQNPGFADGGSPQMYQGQERWIGLQVRFPADFPTGTWISVVQLKGAGDGNGPISITLDDGKLSLHKSNIQAYGTVGMDHVWTSPSATVRDRWIKLLVHVKWSVGSDGFYELFGDLADGQGFRSLIDLTSGWTLKYGQDGRPVSVGARFGIYRGALAQDATAYFDGFNVATTRAAATQRAFGQSL